MGLSRKHFKIAELLATVFTHSQTEEEQDQFEVLRGERPELLERVLNRERYEDFVEAAGRFNSKEGWTAFESGWQLHVRRRRLGYVLRYAAVVLLFVSVGLVLLWREKPAEKLMTSPVLAYRIEAGTTGARLTLAEGRTLDIMKDQVITMQEDDGTLIATDSVGVDYVAQEIGTGEEIWHTLATERGMEYSITLSDGTKIYLNAETELRFPVNFKGKQRVVEVSGEAYFEVAKDVERPFVVKAWELSVQVLGTSFNLRAYEDEREVTTTLAEGKVQVFDGRLFKDIDPNEQVVYDKKARTMRVEEVNVDHYSAWREGRFVFRNERLEDVMAYLAKWYNVEYVFEDEDAKNVCIGAKLNRYDDMNPIIEMLKMNEKMSIMLIDHVYHISSK